RLLGQGTKIAAFHGTTFHMFEWSIHRRKYYVYFYVLLRSMEDSLTSEEMEEFETQLDGILESEEISGELAEMTSITRYVDTEPLMKTCELLNLKNAAMFKVVLRENEQGNYPDMDVFLSKWTDSQAGPLGICDAIPKALNFGASTLSKAYLFCAPQKYSPTYRTAYLYFNATNLGLNEGGHGCIRYIAEQIEAAINLDLQKLFTVEGHSNLRKVEYIGYSIRFGFGEQISRSSHSFIS
ncbi:unnamed protein product, partial [Calicophoron daubneyi]